MTKIVLYRCNVCGYEANPNDIVSIRVTGSALNGRVGYHCKADNSDKHLCRLCAEAGSAFFKDRVIKVDE